jgi:hypothetical protein
MPYGLFRPADMFRVGILLPWDHTRTRLRFVAATYNVPLRSTKAYHGCEPTVLIFAKVVALGSHDAQGENLGRL